MPTATEVPSLEVHFAVYPSPLNPLGVKGVGEAGCIAVGAVIASGIEDALAPLGAGKFHQTPITPSMIHAALEAR
jgi:CO/xanthine dehydrogenase Mo-binding subunit